MSSDSVGTPPVQDEPASRPPPSLIPPADTIRPAQQTIPEFPPPFNAGPATETPPSLRAPIRSLPPLPEVHPIVDDANAARERGAWDEALEHYKKALFVIPSSEKETQASIYASIAEVKISQGKAREAETNYEKALGINPRHTRSLDGLIALATERTDWAQLASARRRKADVLDDPEDKASELCVVAELEEARLGSVEKALATLEIASVHRPDDIGILIKLRDLYTATHAWQKLLATLDDLVRISTDHRHRGAFRFAQADVTLARLRKQEPRGLAFLELALDEDPQCDRALAALVAVRTRREEWAELAAVYERLIDRYAGLGDRDRAWEVCRKLGALRRDRLLDGPGALEAFSGAVEIRPEDAESRATLAELFAAKGDRARAVRELETTSQHAPLRAQTYRRLFELHQRAGRPDRSWLAATCLEELGASDVGHELIIEQFRPEGPIRPTTALNDSWWTELLAAEGADSIVEEILHTIGDAAITLRLEELEQRRALPILDPTKRQEKSSTASAVRTFVWAARALNIAAPDLYVHHHVPSGMAAVPAGVPSTALGPAVLSGRSVQQLAFLAGRHLTYYRPQHYPLVFFPTLAALSSLVLTAVRLVIPAISVPPPPADVEETTVPSRLGERLTPDQRSRLQRVIAKLDARGGKLDLLAWIRGVELTATRAGLLLSGDLRTAMRLLKEETRSIGDLTLETKRADLLTFCASEAYSLIRERMGVAIHPTHSSMNIQAARPVGGKGVDS